MKISIITRDISHNGFGRTYILAKALQKHFEVEIIGQMNEKGVWPPCDTNEFLMKTTGIIRLPFSIKSAKDILSSISGDVIYAMRPSATTYGLALLNKLASGRPVVLDIDDWEASIVRSGHFSLQDKLWALRDPNSYPYAILIEKFIGLSDQVTTVSDFLKHRFGGIKVHHGRDVHWLDPSKYDSKNLKQKWGLETKKVIVWLGTPKPYKGIEDLAQAILQTGRNDIRLLMIGVNEQDDQIREISEILGNLMITVSMTPFRELPSFLAMADLVVLPQRKTPATLGQVPAKLFDAMAMAKPVISTAVSDIPEILAGCGVVVEPGNVNQIAREIVALLEEPNRAIELGRLAREKCVREYSLEVMENTLFHVFSQYDRE